MFIKSSSSSSVGIASNLSGSEMSSARAACFCSNSSALVVGSRPSRLSRSAFAPKGSSNTLPMSASISSGVDDSPRSAGNSLWHIELLYASLHESFSLHLSHTLVEWSSNIDIGLISFYFVVVVPGECFQSVLSRCFGYSVRLLTLAFVPKGSPVSASTSARSINSPNPPVLGKPT